MAILNIHRDSSPPLRSDAPLGAALADATGRGGSGGQRMPDP